MNTREAFSDWFNSVLGDPAPAAQEGQEAQGDDSVTVDEEGKALQAIEAAQQAIEEAKQNPGPKTEKAAQLAIEAAQKAILAVPQKPKYPKVPDGGEIPSVPHARTVYESFEEWLPQVLPPWR